VSLSPRHAYFSLSQRRFGMISVSNVLGSYACSFPFLLSPSPSFALTATLPPIPFYHFCFFLHSFQSNHNILRMQDGDEMAPIEVLLDPNTFSADGTSALGTYTISESGRYLAYAVAKSGSGTWIDEQNSVGVLIDALTLDFFSKTKTGVDFLRLVHGPRAGRGDENRFARRRVGVGQV
jgi:hypothetical protein